MRDALYWVEIGFMLDATVTNYSKVTWNGEITIEKVK